MTSPSDDQSGVLTALLTAVQELSAEVALLRKEVDIADRLRKWSVRLTAAVAFLFLIGCTFGTVQYLRISGAVAQGQQNETTACENANENRASNLLLWSKVLTLSQESAHSQAVKDEIDLLLGWTAVLYAPHDCTDVTKTPEVPTIADYPAHHPVG